MDFIYNLSQQHSTPSGNPWRRNMTGGQPSMIEVKGLTKFYGSKKAVDNLNFTIDSR